MKHIKNIFTSSNKYVSCEEMYCKLQNINIHLQKFLHFDLSIH